MPGNRLVYNIILCHLHTFCIGTKAELRLLSFTWLWVTTLTFSSFDKFILTSCFLESYSPLISEKFQFDFRFVDVCRTWRLSTTLTSCSTS